MFGSMSSIIRHWQWSDGFNHQSLQILLCNSYHLLPSSWHMALGRESWVGKYGSTRLPGGQAEMHRIAASAVRNRYFACKYTARCIFTGPMKSCGRYRYLSYTPRYLSGNVTIQPPTKQPQEHSHQRFPSMPGTSLADFCVKSRGRIGSYKKPRYRVLHGSSQRLFV